MLFQMPAPLPGFSAYLSRQNAAATLTEEMFDLLRRGGAAVHDLQNAVSGHGRNVGVLEAKGLLRVQARRGQVTEYVVTEAGRAALFEHLGVSEVYP